MKDIDVSIGNDVTMRAGASSSQGCIVVKNVGKTAKCVPHRKLFFYAAVGYKV